MKVHTLDKSALQAAATELENKAQLFAPDLIVGIATGGEYVAEMMFSQVPHVTVRSSRPSTEAKQSLGFIWRIIRNLPDFVKDGMRVAEAKWLGRRRSGTQEPLSLSADIITFIARSKKILIVDDAIDTGMTMKRVINAIRGVEGERDIAVAVISVTMSDPIVEADYKLYTGVLVRFPWSKDFKA